MNQANLFDARQARDEGIAKTASKNESWLERAISMLPAMKKEYSYVTGVTGEAVRVWMLAHGLPHPSSQHAWGMLMRVAMKRGLIRDTGRQTQMITERSHARRTPLWLLV